MKETISFRIRKDQRVRLDEYKDKEAMSEADALRDLLDKGLEYDTMQTRLEKVEGELEQMRADQRKMYDAMREWQQQSLLERILGK